MPSQPLWLYQGKKQPGMLTKSTANCFALNLRLELSGAGLTWPNSANVQQVELQSGACAYLHWTIVETDGRSALTHTALSLTDDWWNSGGISLAIHTHTEIARGSHGGHSQSRTNSKRHRGKRTWVDKHTGMASFHFLTAVPWKLSLLQGSDRNFTQMFPLLKSPKRIFQDLVIVQDSHFYSPQIVAQLHTQFVQEWF